MQGDQHFTEKLLVFRLQRQRKAVNDAAQNLEELAHAIKVLRLVNKPEAIHGNRLDNQKHKHHPKKEKNNAHSILVVFFFFCFFSIYFFININIYYDDTLLPGSFHEFYNIVFILSFNLEKVSFLEFWESRENISGTHRIIYVVNRVFQTLKVS